ncbi:hypothetical protein HOT39_gp17 [Escherichia phage LL5]|uniref:Uncharacterized protein n=1 Tax=Escherichia phage LL5 TaxID=2233992 RepID=A0A2Z4Q370_9CAUD|nr:hypothetical protein HOT39_gp17 [Escherichia phage LL5]AWY04319.1 hypothetical protein CPT_LL5_17 [Escherichia phage LL5]
MWLIFILLVIIGNILIVAYCVPFGGTVLAMAGYYVGYKSNE